MYNGSDDIPCWAWRVQLKPASNLSKPAASCVGKRRRATTLRAKPAF